MNYKLIFPERYNSSYHFPNVVGESYASSTSMNITKQFNSDYDLHNIAINDKDCGDVISSFPVDMDLYVTKCVSETENNIYKVIIK